MDNSVVLALAAGGFAVLGSVVTGLFTYMAAVKQREADLYKSRLQQSYRDVAALHRLEERYLSALASESKSARAWKLEVRRRQREEGFATPSDEATTQRAEQRLAELT